MNIEEAKANIGKEVVYIGSINQILNGFSGGTFLITGIHSNGDLVTVGSKDFIFAVEPQELQLKHPTYKVGDQVVLDESTKPYTNKSINGIDTNILFELREEQHSITSILNNECVVIKNSIGGEVAINPRHLKLAPQGEDQDFLKGDPVINGIHADIHNAMKGEHKELLKLVINGKEIKNFNADEEVLSKPKSLLSEIQVPINVKVDVIVDDKSRYHSQEMRVYRDEVAQMLLANGVPLDKDFKNKIDLYVNAVTTK